MITKNIESLGVECEGGIDYKDLDKLEKYIETNDLTDFYSVTNDGSVLVYDKDIRDIEIRFYHYDLDIILDFLRYLFSECNFKTNSSCGFHVHVRFVNMEKAISLFSYEKVWEIFLNEYKKKFKDFKYIRRLANRYCGAIYSEGDIVGQLDGLDGYRYRAINLKAVYDHDTIEFRILPGMDSFTEAKNAILWLIDVIDSIINKKFIIFSEMLGFDNFNIDNKIHIKENIECYDNKIKIKM
ncbi:MAG: hypothetical protein QXI58_08390 [Candidatus Micrarchaeia archaeon]